MKYSDPLSYCSQTFSWPQIHGGWTGLPSRALWLLSWDGVGQHRFQQERATQTTPIPDHMFLLFRMGKTSFPPFWGFPGNAPCPCSRCDGCLYHWNPKLDNTLALTSLFMDLAVTRVSGLTLDLVLAACLMCLSHAHWPIGRSVGVGRPRPWGKWEGWQWSHEGQDKIWGQF